MTGLQDHCLVLGSGGVAGIAWQTGLLAGLARAGVDLTLAGTVMGTSAGATVAAQITGSVSLEQLVSRQLDGSGAPEPAINIDLAALGRDIQAATAGAASSEDALRAIGALALEHDRVPEAERRAVIEARLADRSWPDRRLLLVAVSATTGRPVVFDRSSGVSLVDAVAASCAIPRAWPPVTIGDDRYIDGGARSSTNTDLLELDGTRVTVVVDVLGASGRALVSREAEGGRFWFTIEPDEGSRVALADLLDPDARVRAATAGIAQGAAEAPHLADAWGRP